MISCIAWGRNKMTTLSQGRFLRYLAAKKAIDDRSIHKRVWDTLRESVASSQPKGDIKIFEAGCGIGTMLERIIDWKPAPRVLYTGIDASWQCIAEALKRLRRLCAETGLELVEEKPGRLTLRDREFSLTAELIASDLFDFLSENSTPGSWDLLMAHSFLDLVDITKTMALFLLAVRPEGLVYFTLNFDGLTAFEPVIEKELDEEIEQLYHETMDKRFIKGGSKGGSRTGRSLLSLLKDHHVRILDSGSSDWICVAKEKGYGMDEAFFLHFIVDTVGEALSGHPRLDRERFSRWLEQRHRQIETGRLIYIAHQLDVVGRLSQSDQ
jgi:SAM-dependent methyltransferase